jgi:hypothetical protein
LRAADGVLPFEPTRNAASSPVSTWPANRHLLSALSWAKGRNPKIARRGIKPGPEPDHDDAGLEPSRPEVETSAPPDCDSDDRYCSLSSGAGARSPTAPASARTGEAGAPRASASASERAALNALAVVNPSLNACGAP